MKQFLYDIGPLTLIRWPLYSSSRFRRGPQDEDDFKNEDDLKNEDNLKNKDEQAGAELCQARQGFS